MSTITAIEPQHRSPRRVNIHLDGSYAFSLDRLVSAWLKVGQHLSDEQAAGLQAADLDEGAFQKAVHFLSFRPRTIAEVRRNLSDRGLPEELVESTLSRLQQAGLLDDGAFARNWVENRSAFRPRSRRALTVELRRKGLSQETIAPALEDLDETSLARQAAEKYAHRLADLPRDEFRSKLYGFLSRRGFTYDVIAPVVSEIWQAMQMADNREILKDKD